MNERQWEVWRRRDASGPWRSMYSGSHDACQLYVRRFIRGHRPGLSVEFLTRPVGYWPVAKDVADVAMP